MARLHEYQGKAILAANGFKIPRGRAAATADEAIAAAKELAGSPQDGSVRLADKKNCEVVVKIQAWTTGRAGIGGVAFAKDPDDVRAHVARMLAMKLSLRAAFRRRTQRNLLSRFTNYLPQRAVLKPAHLKLIR